MFTKISSLLLTSALSLLVVPMIQAEEIPLDRIVAVVNKGIILQSELERRTEVIRQQLIDRNTALPPASALTRQVLDKLILDRIQQQQAAENGIKISEQSLNETLLKIAKSNGLSLAQFKQTLESEGQNYTEVRDQISSEMLITQVRERLVNRRIQITDQEVENYLNSERGQDRLAAELHLAHILIANSSPATPESIKASKNKALKLYSDLKSGADFAALAVTHSAGQQALQGGDLGWRKQTELPELIASAVENLKVDQISQPIRASSGFHILKLLEKRGGKVQLIEQANVRHILIKPNEIRTPNEAKQLIESLHARLQQGEDFAALSREHSDDPGSASAGGDLGWTMPGQMVPAFEQALQNTVTGELSVPFKSSFGWHILQVQERRQQDFGEKILANEARETIRKRKFNEELQNWLREIKAQAYIEKKI
jgi:peptidyl-prolyl cis-trans isomerase SurA